MDNAVKKPAKQKPVKPVKNESPKAAKASSPKRKKAVSLDKKKARAGWIFVMPFVIGLAVLYIPILFNSILLSFQEYVGSKVSFVGFENYQEALLEDTDFIQLLTTGLTDIVLNIPAIVFLSLFLAILLNQKMVGRAAFRAILFVPVILSTGLIDQMMTATGASSQAGGTEGQIDQGLQDESVTDQLISAADITRLFSNMKIGTELVTYITTLVNDIYNIVNDAGVQLLIFLAGLQSISPAIYESCSIDGATTWETFWKVTFPMISPMILVNAIYTVIDSFTKADNSVMSYIQTYYNTKSATVATAMAWIYFLIVVAIVAAVAALIKTFVFYQRRD
ncbi:MAG: sugar ABC transporter permease [Ruminococcaceae bacterium]|nr:sugar ABC transporter permease [Oscillospiraceae bacterium]